MRIRALAGVAVLAAAVPSLAADLQVGKGRRYATIQAAVDAAVPGDRIVVARGVYREFVTFVGKDDLTFVGRGAVWDGQISRGNAAPCLEFEASGVSVEGFTFRNGAYHVRAWGDRNTVRKCVSRNADGWAFRMEASGATVASCRVSGVRGMAIEILGDSATVTSNRCANSENAAVGVQGAGARVVRNVVQTVRDGAGMYVHGDDAQVLSNKVTNTALGAIVVSGEDVVVTGNVCAHTAHEACIDVTGPRATVEDNRVTGSADVGVSVSGEGMSVRRNRVASSLRGAPGFVLRNTDSPGGGTVEDNVAVRAGQVGFELSLVNTTVRRCVAVDCGRGDGAAFWITGTQTAIVACRAEGAFETAFAVHGNDLDLEGCVARDATGDGFQVRGPDNRLVDCQATGCGGEGLDNGATETALDGCTLRGNRIDLACDILSGATFRDAARLETDNTWVTGGPDTQPERDD